MATKAELERELAALRKELAALKDQAEEAVSDEDAGNDDGTRSGLHDIPGDILSAIRGADLEGMAKQLTGELETSMQEKPLLTALAILLVGYTLGRIR